MGEAWLPRVVVPAISQARGCYLGLLGATEQDECVQHFAPGPQFCPRSPLPTPEIYHIGLTEVTPPWNRVHAEVLWFCSDLEPLSGVVSYIVRSCLSGKSQRDRLQPTRCVKCRSSPPSLSRTFSFSQMETGYQLNNNSPTPFPHHLETTILLSIWIWLP